MSRLTAERLATAEPVLDRYLDKLRRDRFFSTAALERELSDLWRIGYQEVTGVIADLAGHPGYRLVAAYYMENVAVDVPRPLDAPPRSDDVAAEFHAPLAKLYGLASYGSDGRDERRAEFWRRAFDGRDGVGLPAEEYEGPRFVACDDAGNEHVLTPVYRCRTDGAGRRAGDGYEARDLALIVAATGGRVRYDGPGRYVLLDSRAGGETPLTSRDPHAV